MADYINMDTLRFILNDVHDLEELIKHDRFQDYDNDSINMLLDAIKDFSDQELHPVIMEMDENPAHYKDGSVVVHPIVGKLMSRSAEMGLIGGTFDYEAGGMQMPGIVSSAINFVLDAANNHMAGYPGLTAGAAHLIIAFGNEALNNTYVPKMLEGQWGGTMCLTEPQAGSSLSDITTTAYPQEDGSYKIEGQKIFISGGDHQFADNFVHLVLARIEGAPAGTKGVSLFVVPKHRPTADGSLEPNDVITAGDFQKLGQKGYCTTHLVFGEKDNCRGWLVGTPHQGLRYMFQMMNEARISVGRGAAAIACAAYHASLQYANERPQGRKLGSSGKKDVDQGQTLIINHPDVRRMLLLQKAVYEGSLSLVLQSSWYHDMVNVSEGEDKEAYHLLLELLTPITKTYPSEMGMISISNGLQILGGYGFCSEFILQLYYRDIRIYSLYEGTTGIQSLDLLGRKITMHGGKAIALLAKEAQQTIEAAITFDELKPYALQLGEKLGLAQKVIAHLIGFAQKGEYERFLSDATIFMEFFGNIVIAWQWLKMGTAAKKALVTGDMPYSAEFYESKVHTMKFFYKYELSKTVSAAQILMSDEVLTVQQGKEIIV